MHLYKQKCPSKFYTAFKNQTMYIDMYNVDTIISIHGLSTNILTRPSTKEKTSLRFDPMCSHSGHWDLTTGSGCVGNSNAAMQHMLTATATTFRG